MENNAKKKEELLIANNVLKLASKLLKVSETTHSYFSGIVFECILILIVNIHIRNQTWRKKL